MFSGGPDEIDRRIDEWAAQVQDKAQRYQQLKEDLTQISATANAANGTVTVTVGPSGLLQRLQLTDDIQRMRGTYLAEQIMTAIHTAQSTLGAQVTDLMRERVGDDAASIETVARNYAAQFPDAAEDTPPQSADTLEDDDYFARGAFPHSDDDRPRGL